MKNIFNSVGFISLLLAFSSMTYSSHHADPLLEAIKDPARNSAYSARDNYRHPYETLSFFKITPSMQVLELAAGGGWYTEILSPYLRDAGSLTVTHNNPESGAYSKRSRTAFDKKIQSNPLFEGVTVVTMGEPLTPKSKDLVLTFRNLHNWLARDTMKATMLEAFNALKSGGFFGVVEHRAPEGSSMEYMTTSGYVSQSLAIEVAESVGFTLVETSEINANLKDTKDHPKGVWTLPPSYRLKDENRSKYEAMGESDRMTLLFMK